MVIATVFVFVLLRVMEVKGDKLSLLSLTVLFGFSVLCSVFCS